MTSQIDLPGGQDRLRQLILYVSARCEKAERFGLVKLNKIIWKADFDSFAKRRWPITGRMYQRLKNGPALREMRPLLNELERLGFIEYKNTAFPKGIEQRPIAQIPPKLHHFTRDDLEFVESSITYYWEKTGTESSDDSHGMAWKARENKQIMHYELAHLSDNHDITPIQRIEIMAKVTERLKTK